MVLAVGLFLIFCLPRQSVAVNSVNPLSLFSSASTSCGGCSSLSMDLRVAANSLVVVQVVVSPESVYLRSSGAGYHAGFLTSLTSPGMTFQQRYAWTINPGSGDGSEVWEDYSIAVVTSVITITGETNSSLTAWSMIGYAVQGVNDTAPFDSNPAIPNGDFNDCNLTDGCSATFSTTSADTMVIAGLGSEGNPNFTAPGNFTLIQSNVASGWVANGVAYRLFSSPETGVPTGSWGMTGLSCTQAPGNSCGESALWFVDAIQACVSSCPTQTTSVVQPISIGMTNSAPISNVTVNGCVASPSTFPSDGKSHLVTMISSCPFTLSFSNMGNVRDGFSESGIFNASSPPQSSCEAGTCPAILLTAYQQLQNTYLAKPADPGTWNAGLMIPVSGTQLGVAGQAGCSISTARGGGAASCTAWFDYRTQVTVAGLIPVSGTEQWIQSGTVDFTQATGGNQDTVNFIDQFQVSFTASPPGAGSTKPSGSNLWESYGSLPVTATPNGNYLFSNWSANVGGITFTSADSVSTTAAILASGTITATFSAPVTQRITLTLAEQQGSSSYFTLSGCSVSPTSLSGDGESHAFTALPSCQLTITVAWNPSGVRFGFNNEGALSNTTSVTTCSVQTCSVFSTTYYEQMRQQFAYEVVGGAAFYVEAPVLSYTALGTPTTYTETGNPTTQWLDFGTSWSLANLLWGSSGAERWIASAGTSGIATAGGEQTTSYQHQYSVLIAASPANCGSTTPSGVIWENAGDNFQVMTSASPGCTFSTWEETGLITVPAPGQLLTTAFADSNGTLTASLTRNPLPAFPAGMIIPVTGVGVVAVAFVGLIYVRNRAHRSRIPHE
jgi:hypothetical protein